jgi:uncharacterized protein YbaR (Trm112 family)
VACIKTYNLNQFYACPCCKGTLERKYTKDKNFLLLKCVDCSAVFEPIGKGIPCETLEYKRVL